MLWVGHVERIDEMIPTKVRLANLKGRDQFWKRTIRSKYTVKIDLRGTL
jgi:hypothetical protein